MGKVNTSHKKYETNRCLSRNTKLIYIHHILLIITVMISISATIISIYCFVNTSNTKAVHRQQKGDSSKACRDCINEVMNGYVNNSKTSKKSRFNGIYIPCCDVNIVQLIRMQQNLSHLKMEEIIKQSYLQLQSPASAHIYLLPSDQTMNFSNVDHVTVQLDTSSNETNSINHARGVVIKQDGIEIVHTGMYYLYSCIYYQPNTNVSSEHFPYQTWFHYVYRTRPNSPAMSSVILRTVFTCCPSCSNSKDNVYTAGIFRLVAGDVIQVCLSGQGIMGNDTVKESSHLGLYMLSSDLG